MSETKPEGLTSRLLAAQAAVKELPKDAENAYDHYKYTSADAIIAEARRVLNGAGLVVRRHGYKIEAFPIEGFLSVVSHYRVEDPETGEAIVATIAYPFSPDRGRQWAKALSAALTTSLAYWLRDLLLIPRSDAEVDNQGTDDPTPDPPRSPTTPHKAPGSHKGRPPAKVDAKPKPLDKAVEVALADLVACVRNFNAEEPASDDELRDKAIKHFLDKGQTVTEIRLRKLIGQIVERNKADKPEEEDQVRTKVLDEIASSKAATAIFEPLRTSAEFADTAGDPIAYLIAMGTDVSTKEGRLEVAAALKAGISWAQYRKGSK